jgi:tRNA 5-methylaminomethyl-2-thiouridine biosynthesis bifunctional protein
MLGLPASLIEPVDRDKASAIAGHPAAEPGWWLPSGGYADPRVVCRAGIPKGVRARFASSAVGLRRTDPDWEVLGTDGQVLARAPVIVLANARDAATFSGVQTLPLDATRGQMSFVPSRPGRAISIPVCREGFITPAVDGFHCVGASYNLGSDVRETTLADHQGNLDRLERILPGFAAGVDARSLSGRVSFRTVAPDRMPVLGELAGTNDQAERSGLFACAGLASRGLTWAPLLAETLACMITGEPAPIERDLLRMIAPSRFARRG